jgi:hypothetical protein
VELVEDKIAKNAIPTLRKQYGKLKGQMLQGTNTVRGGKAMSVKLKVLIGVGLLAVAGVVVLSGFGLAVIFLIGATLALLWWFTRRPRPEEEMPCGSVSCCHYLEEHEEDSSPQK